MSHAYEPTRSDFTSEYVFFKLLDCDLKTGTMKFALIHKKSGDELGRIGWFPKWNQYAFQPPPRAVAYSHGLLRDIQHALIDLNREHSIRERQRKN